ncbi:hypothetical protein [Bradyrhizobium barranii]|uniref:ATP-dependent DNA ligase n=1 Tax=Bradyrhizobium barranii TaxID=2992140 RepID=UPI003CCAB546
MIRDGVAVQDRSRAGLDLTYRYPMIVEAARKIRAKQLVIDGEICVLDVRGVSQFDWLHSGRYNDDAQLYAFDIIALDGDDLRPMQLDQRKSKLAAVTAPTNFAGSTFFSEAHATRFSGRYDSSRRQRSKTDPSMVSLIRDVVAAVPLSGARPTGR